MPVRPLARARTAGRRRPRPWSACPGRSAGSAGRARTAGSARSRSCPASAGGIATITRLAVTVTRRRRRSRRERSARSVAPARSARRRAPSCSAILIGSTLRAADEAVLLGAAARVEVALERPRVLRVARGGDVEQREQQRQLARLGAEDRPQRRGGQLAGTAGVAVCSVSHVCERLAVQRGGVRRRPRRVDRDRSWRACRAPARSWRARPRSSDRAARSRTARGRCRSAARRRRRRRRRRCRRPGTCRSSARGRACATWSWVGPMNVPPRSETWPWPRSWFQTRPPTRSRASSTTTDVRRAAAARGGVRPARPAPTTTTSGRCGGARTAGAWKRRRRRGSAAASPRCHASPRRSRGG